MADLSGVDYNNADHLPDDFQVKMPTDSVFKQWAAAAGATVSSAFVFTRRGARRLKDFVLVAEANPNR